MLCIVMKCYIVKLGLMQFDKHFYLILIHNFVIFRTQQHQTVLAQSMVADWI